MNTALSIMVLVSGVLALRTNLLLLLLAEYPRVKEHEPWEDALGIIFGAGFVTMAILALAL